MSLGNRGGGSLEVGEEGGGDEGRNGREECERGGRGFGW